MLPLPAGDNLKEASLGKTRMALSCQQLEPVAVISANTNPQLEEVRVDMACMRVESKPVELLTSVGSCVAVCMYDSVHRCGGLAHVMLPSSSIGPPEPLPSKFANTAVPALAQGIRGLTGTSTRLSAKIAGGANMFANTCANKLDVGAKNVKAVKRALAEHKISLIGEDVGGSYGRRVTFNVASGKAIVRSHNGEIKNI